MSMPLVTPEGTMTTSTYSSVASLVPEIPSPQKRRLPKGRVFIHRLPRTSFTTATSERYAYDDDFPSIAASDSTHACFPPSPPLPHSESVQEPDRASFRDKMWRISKRGDSGESSIIEDYREKRREVGCAEFFISWFGRKEKDLDPPLWHSETEQEDLKMFSIVGYDDFMHGGRRPSAASRMMARLRGG